MLQRQGLQLFCYTDGCQELGWIVGHPSVTSFDDPPLELRRLRDRVKQKQQDSKRYTDDRRAARETTVNVGDFVRVKKSTSRFKGDREFSRPREVISKKGPSSFDLDDGKTWNASKFSKVPRASGALYTWGRSSTASEGGSWPTCEGPTPETNTRTSAAPPSAAQAPMSPSAAQAHMSPAATQSSKSPGAFTQQRRVQPPRSRRPPDRYRYNV